jgi:hypothetical protein
VTVGAVLAGPPFPASARLIRYVWLTDAAGGRVLFEPGDDPPTWARARITNPEAWDTPPFGGGQ